MRSITTMALVASLGMVCMNGWGQAAETTLSTERPGNLYAHAEPIALQVTSGERGDLAWSVVDYDGERVASGKTSVAAGKGTVKLPSLGRGYYELSWTLGQQAGKVPFGVVTDHSAGPPASGRLNVDGATAWLEHKGRHEQLARILRVMGVGWVRERFSWGATEREKGKIEYAYKGTDYDKVADAYSGEGVRVYQIWHDSPSWTRPGKTGTRNPDDLRDAFNFARRLAQHYKGRVQAWEVWNEPDISFWPDLGDTFAGLQKAAYLGFKAGDPDLTVLMGSFCRGYCPFDDSLFEAGIREYFDVFNWHIYAPPERYAPTLSRYLELLSRYDCDDRPVWLTEAGIRLNATQEGGELSAADERKQAEFIAPSFAGSLAAGTDRHFFFVYPWYLERGVQFGSLREDLSPRPGLVAIAAAVDIMGQATYLGQCDFTDPQAGPWGLVFHNGRQRVLVAWAREEQPVQVDVGAETVELANLVGARSQARTTDGKLTMTLGPSPQYILGLGDGAMTRVEGETRAPGALPDTDPHPVVIRGQALGQPLDKGANAYLVGEQSFDYRVEVCNLQDGRAVSGRIELALPEDWTAEPTSFDVALEPMGRVEQTVRITPAKPARSSQKVWVRGEFGQRDPQPSVSYVQADIARMKPVAELDLGLNDPAEWSKNITGIGEMDIAPGTDGGVVFSAKFLRPGDRWCYPRVSFDPVVDWSEYDGIALEYRTAGDDAMTARFQVVEHSGSSYMVSEGWPASAQWRQVADLFSDLRWGSFSAPDDNNRLDIDRISAFMAGLNTRKDEVELHVRNVRLIKLWD